MSTIKYIHDSWNVVIFSKNKTLHNKPIIWNAKFNTMYFTDLGTSFNNLKSIMLAPFQ